LTLCQERYWTYEKLYSTKVTCRTNGGRKPRGSDNPDSYFLIAAVK